MTKKILTALDVLGALTVTGAPLRMTTAGPTANIQCGAPTFVTFFDSTFTTRQGYIGPSPALTHIELVAENSLSARITSPTSIINRIGVVDTMTISSSSVTTAVPVTLPADPSTALQASTKQYVDARTGTGGQWTPRGFCAESTTMAPATTATKIPLTNVLWNDGEFVIVNGEAVCQVAGRFQVIVRCAPNSVTADANGRIMAAAWVNGAASAPEASTIWPVAISTGRPMFQSSTVINLVPGDAVSYQSFVDSGLAGDITLNGPGSTLTLERMGGPPGPAGPPGSYNPHGLQVPAAATTLVSNSNTIINLGTPVINDDGWTVTSNEAICPIAGRYHIIGQVRVDGSPTSPYRVQVTMMKNGVDFSPRILSGYVNHATTSTAVLMPPAQASGIVDLAIGDRITMICLHSNYTLPIETTWSSLRIERIGAGPPGPPGSYDPHGVMFPAVATTLGNNSFTTINLGTALWNNDGWTHDGDEAVCPVSGRYLITGQVDADYTMEVGGRYVLRLLKNAAVFDPPAESGTWHAQSLNTYNAAPMQISYVANLVAGDKIALQCNIWAGTTKPIDPTRTWLNIERIGAGPQGPAGPPGSIGTGGTMTGSFQINHTTDVDLSVPDPPLMIGTLGSYNMAIDSNEIQARNNGLTAGLQFQPYGNSVYIGAGLSGVVTDNFISWWFTRGPRIALYPKLDPNGAYEIGMQPSGVYHRIGHTGAAFNWYADGEFSDVADDPGPNGGVHLAKLNGLGDFMLGGTCPTSFVNYGTTKVWITDAANGSLSTAATGTGVISFTTNALERARIDSAGTSLFGKTVSGVAGSGHELFVRGDHYTTVDTNRPNIICNKVDVAIAASGVFISFRHDNTQIGRIERNASTSAVLYQISSDYRLKNDLGPVIDALERIKMLKPHRITWKEDPTETEMTAFLAHEVQEVAPWAVTGEKDAVTPEPVDDADPPAGQIAPQMMDQTALIPLLTAAVQELTSRVEALES